MRLQHTPDQDGFIEEPYLFSLGLVYQTRRKVIVCRECLQGILPTKVKHHFKDAHKEDKINVNMDRINQIANMSNIPKSYPQPWIEGPYPEVAGLAIVTGFKCPHCFRVSTSTEKLRKMYSIDHPNNTGPVPKSWTSCHIKQIHPGAAKSLWWAQPANAPVPSSTEQTLATLQSTVDEWLKIEPVTRDARVISPWLLANKWHLYIGALDKPTLAHLVTLPGHQDTLYHLSHNIKEYFAQCESFLSNTDVLVLQHLNSPNPAET